ncbi:33917_t:CDS:2, partial [Gigaspora margarita]
KSKLEELKTQVVSLISKATRLENNKNSIQNENNKLRQENITLQCIVEDNKTELERYYNTIQKTYLILQSLVIFDEIETCEGEDFVNENDTNISRAYTHSNNIVFNSFEEALDASGPKI